MKSTTLLFILILTLSVPTTRADLPNFIAKLFNFKPDYQFRSCYQCLALDCPSDDNKTCEDVRTFVMQELRSYYVFDYLPPCPPDDDNGSDWLGMWVSAGTYTRSLPNVCHPTADVKKEVCLAGKIQVRSTTKDCTIVSHAAVLGCARQKLVDILAANLVMKNASCHEIPNLMGTVSEGIRHEMILKHCNIPGAICNHRDYCVNVTHAVVQIPNEGEDRVVCPMKTGTIVGIVSGVVGGVVMLIGIGVCLFSIYRKKQNPPVKKVLEIVDCSAPMGWQR